VFEKAGFGSFRKAAQTPMNLILEARPSLPVRRSPSMAGRRRSASNRQSARRGPTAQVSTRSPGEVTEGSAAPDEQRVRRHLGPRGGRRGSNQDFRRADAEA
jgi:hypothetical protein